MVSITNMVFAYVGGPLVVAPLASIAGVLIGYLNLVKRSLIWSWASGVGQAIAAIYACSALFLWLGVSFEWYSKLICMLPIMMNDGRRTQREEAAATFGPEKATAFGTLCGIIYALFS